MKTHQPLSVCFEWAPQTVGMMEHMGEKHTLNELVARLAAAKVENEVLRHSMIPPLGAGTLGRLMTSRVAYAWMGMLLANLKEYSN